MQLVTLDAESHKDYDVLATSINRVTYQDLHESDKSLSYRNTRIRNAAGTSATNKKIPMNTYLSLNSAEEREYAAAHVHWLRERAIQLRPKNPDKAKKCDQDASDLEEAIQIRRTL
jgi:hypothetical protein